MKTKYTQRLGSIALIVCLSLWQKTMGAQTRQSDSLALVKFFQSTNGSSWTKKWDLSKSMDNWDGVTLNFQGRVTQIYVLYNNMSGVLPPELGNLTELTFLRVNNTDIQGTIPKELGNLKKLDNLNLQYNKIAGQIPEEIGNMTSLQYLLLSSNQLSGTIPIQVIANSSLRSIFIGNNKFTGAIPKALFETTHINGIQLDFNDFTSFETPTIPAGTQITSLSVYDCMLSGKVPNWIFQLRKMTVLTLQQNAFSGPLSDSILMLKELESLWISDNNMTIDIAKWENELVYLADLRANGNKINGPITKKFIDNHPKMFFLGLNNCGITSLPTLPTLSGWLMVENNFLDFDDLYKNRNVTNYFNFKPQRKYRDSTYLVGKLGNTIVLDGEAGGQNTKYQWYRNGNVLSGKTANKLTINNLAYSDSGIYYSIATNDSLPGLTLTRNSITLRVTETGTSTVSNIQAFDFQIYPNPSDGWFKLEMADAIKIKTIDVFDLKGKLLKSYNPNADVVYVLPKSCISSNINILKVQFMNGAFIYKKLILNK